MGLAVGVGVVLLAAFAAAMPLVAMWDHHSDRTHRKPVRAFQGARPVLRPPPSRTPRGPHALISRAHSHPVNEVVTRPVSKRSTSYPVIPMGGLCIPTAKCSLPVSML